MKDLTINFFQVGCGDAISIRYFGNDNVYHNILIDGGKYSDTYFSKTFKPEISAIYERGEKIDLWIISHIHNDHIGGIMKFIEDTELKNIVDVKKLNIWFNYTYLDKTVNPIQSKKVNVKQGITLRNFLLDNVLLEENKTNNLKQDFYGANITILSPDYDKYSKLVREWRKGERRLLPKFEKPTNASNASNGYNTKLGDFDLSKKHKDSSIENGSSIAFLFEYQDVKILFSADSHPQVIRKSIENLTDSNGNNYSNENKLHLDYFQVAHHGSKYNTDTEVLKIIDCENYIFSADGLSAKPHKVVIDRILNNNHNNLKTNLYFNHDTTILRKMFNIDGRNLKKKYDFECLYPKTNNSLIISIK